MKIEYRVLIIDDDKQTLDLISEELEGQGVETDLLLVESYLDPAAWSARRYDAFLVDVMLPHENGFDLADRIQRSLPYKVNIVLMSQSPEEFKELASQNSLPLRPKEQILDNSRLAQEFLNKAPLRCLVCDDTIRSGQVLKEHLEDIGFEVELASSIEDARRHIRKSHFHLVLVDIFWKTPSGLDPDGVKLLEALDSSFRRRAVAFSQYSQAFEGGIGADLKRLKVKELRKSRLLGPQIEDFIASICPVLNEVASA